MVSSSKIGGFAGLVTLLMILLFEVAIPSAIAGNGPNSTTGSDILAFYNHPVLVWTFWADGITVLFFLVFVYGLYLTLRDKAGMAGLSVFLLAGVAIAVTEVPALLTEYSLQSALVSIAGQHIVTTDAVSRAALEAAGVGLFRIWDFLYNSLIYWLEGGYLLLFSVVSLRTGIFRRPVGWLGVIAAVYQFFSTTAVPAGLPDSLTLPGNLLLAAWFAVVSISLLRVKTQPE